MPPPTTNVHNDKRTQNLQGKSQSCHMARELLTNKKYETELDSHYFSVTEKDYLIHDGET